MSRKKIGSFFLNNVYIQINNPGGHVKGKKLILWNVQFQGEWTVSVLISG
jgi:hypothetical protein